MLIRLVHVSLLSLLLLAAPMLVAAQSAEREQLRATIMAQVLQDPRSASIPPEQLQLLIEALSQQAGEQEVAVEDILWQPAIVFGASAPEVAAQPLSACESPFSYACLIAEAFGFVGDNPTIPLYFLVASGLLILLITRMHRHHAQEVHATAAASQSSVGTYL